MSPVSWQSCTKTGWWKRNKFMQRLLARKFRSMRDQSAFTLFWLFPTWLLLGLYRLLILTMPLKHMAPFYGEDLGVENWVPLADPAQIRRASDIRSTVAVSFDQNRRVLAGQMLIDILSPAGIPGCIDRGITGEFDTKLSAATGPALDVAVEQHHRTVRCTGRFLSRPGMAVADQCTIAHRRTRQNLADPERGRERGSAGLHCIRVLPKRIEADHQCLRRYLLAGQQHQVPPPIRHARDAPIRFWFLWR